MSNPLNKTAFIEWLEKQAPGGSVGLPIDEFMCPLCKFVQHQGFEGVCFQYNRWTYEGAGGWLEVPPWAELFQRRATMDIESRKTQREWVTAKQALGYMRHG